MCQVLLLEHCGELIACSAVAGVVAAMSTAASRRVRGEAAAAVAAAATEGPLHAAMRLVEAMQAGLAVVEQR